jgi:hypothetical protein
MIFGINPADITGVATQPMQEQVQPGGEQNAKPSLSVTGPTPMLTSSVESSARSTRCRRSGPVSSPTSAKSGSRRRPSSIAARPQSACGTASNQVGPFYCPLDKKVYIDASFFQTARAAVRQQRRTTRAGVRRGPRVRPRPSGPARAPRSRTAGPDRARFRCRSDRTHGRLPRRGVGPPRDHGQGPRHRDALPRSRSPSRTSRTPCPPHPPSATTASSRRPRAGSTPENWTHGSAEARQRWFLQGFKTGDLNQCDTFAVASVN